MYYILVIQQYSYDVYAPRCCDGRSVYWMNPNKSKQNGQEQRSGKLSAKCL